MPCYKCHKEVWALKISRVVENSNGGVDLSFESEDGFVPVRMDADWFGKHNPVEGGYYVVYKDGYKSFSLAEAFEDGYTLVK